MTSDNVSEGTRKKLREYRTETSSFKDAQQDNIYVVESLLETKKDQWRVKWLGFPAQMSTWEPSTNIQSWVISCYSDYPERS